MIVDSIMARNVVTVSAAASAREAARRMREASIGGLVVTRADEAVGIVTERDLVQRVLATGLDAEQTRVADVMSAPLLTIEPSASLEEAAQLMKAHRVKRLVVILDADVRGIVTVTDIAHARPDISQRVLDTWIRQRWQD